jgi:hypothetical protein
MMQLSLARYVLLCGQQLLTYIPQPVSHSYVQRLPLMLAVGEPSGYQAGILTNGCTDFAGVQGGSC